MIRQFALKWETRLPIKLCKEVATSSNASLAALTGGNSDDQSIYQQNLKEQSKLLDKHQFETPE